MNIFRYILAPLYRIWFYILIIGSILILSPFLIIGILKESWYPLFFKTARIWAKITLFGMGFFLKVNRNEVFEKGESYMFVSNHASMTDVMLMLYLVKNPFVFVGKAELGKLPIFGFFYKRTCILVDRNSPKSRREVFIQAQRKLKQGLSICIFPEGGVPDDMSIVLDSFKDGAFRLAIDHHIAIAPMTFHDNKKRFPFSFFRGTPGIMRATVHPTIPTKILEAEDRRVLREETRDIILQELENPTV